MYIYTTKISIFKLLQQLNNGKIVIIETYKDFEHDQDERVIKMIFMGIPLNHLYVDVDTVGNLIIKKDAVTASSIVNYYNNEFAVGGRFFKDLKTQEQSYFEDTFLDFVCIHSPDNWEIVDEILKK